MSVVPLALSDLLPAMPPSSAFQWFLLVCPVVVSLAYFFTVFPHTPDSLYIHPSLATLPKSNPSWSLYPDDYFSGGAYAKFPYGAVSRVFAAHIAFISQPLLHKVRYWLIGPKLDKRIQFMVSDFNSSIPRAS